MDSLLKSVFSWGDFLSMSLLLLAFYFLLKIAQRILPRTEFPDRISEPIEKGIYYVLLFYEPLVLLLLGTVFVLVNPLFHGLLVALLLLGGFSHIRNYLSGRLVQFDRTISIGKRLQTDKTQGIIAEKGRLGLRLRSNKGLHFVSYAQLLRTGYLLRSGEDIGGFYQLELSPKNLDEKMDHIHRLSDLLATNPYVDWTYPMELRSSLHGEHPYHLRVSVKEENHLRDLMLLIEKDWNYSCTISKNKN